MLAQHLFTNVRRRIALVAEDEDYLVLNVNREAAKHGASLGGQRRDRVEHELMRDGFRCLIAKGVSSSGKEALWRRSLGMADALRERRR
jgi:hypothetical protein